jgi:hypothetical protein
VPQTVKIIKKYDLQRIKKLIIYKKKKDRGKGKRRIVYIL